MAENMISLMTVRPESRLMNDLFQPFGNLPAAEKSIGRRHLAQDVRAKPRSGRQTQFGHCQRAVQTVVDQASLARCAPA
jgi:hypothetical protein